MSFLLACVMVVGTGGNATPVLAQSLVPSDTAAVHSVATTSPLASMSLAVQEAIDHNPTLVALRHEVEASRADEVTASLRPNPALTVNADILPSAGIPVSQKNYGVSIAMPIELGGKRDARIALASSSTELAALQYEDAVRQIVLNVRSTYIDYVSALAKVDAAKENLQLLDSLVSLSSIRVAGKDIAPVELMRTQVEREKFSLEVNRAIEDSRATRVSLLSQLGRASTIATSGEASTSAILQAQVGTLPSLDSLTAVIEVSRPDLLAARAQIKTAEQSLALQHSMANIDMSVSLDYSRSQGVSYYGSTLSIPLPIYNRNQGEIEKAEARLAEARDQYNALLLQARTDLTNVWNDARAKGETLQRLQNDLLQRSLEVRNAIEYSYRRGGTSLIDLLDATRTYNEMKQARIDAAALYVKSLVTLNATLGKDLFHDLN